MERQKAEAERRLETLDNQVSQLEQTGSSLKEKLIEEENRLESLRNENMRNKENIAVRVEHFDFSLFASFIYDLFFMYLIYIYLY